MASGKLYNGDCLAVMRTMQDNSVSNIVTDPPYGLSFMGKKWDYDVPSVEIWREALRVLKPGGTALIFAGSRTQHRMAVNIEDAGFVLKDTIEYLMEPDAQAFYKTLDPQQKKDFLSLMGGNSMFWVYGSGFPKSTDISKQIDKVSKRLNMFKPFADYLKRKISESNLSRKQISEHFPSKTGGLTGCVWNWENAENVPTKEQFEILKNLLDLSNEFTELIDRVEAEREVIGKDKSGKNAMLGGLQGVENGGEFNITAPATPAAQLWNGYGTALKPAYEPIIVAMKPNDGTYANNALKHGVAGINIDGCRVGMSEDDFNQYKDKRESFNNTIGSDVYGGNALLNSKTKAENHIETKGRFPANIIHDGSDEVLRLFPETKSGARSGKHKNKIYAQGIKKENEINSGNYFDSSSGSAARFFYCAKASKKERGEGNNHPTVKPLSLMKYLVNLVTPPKNGIILDPFLGSGTTGVACKSLGISFIGIEKDIEHGYYEIARDRIAQC